MSLAKHIDAQEPIPQEGSPPDVASRALKTFLSVDINPTLNLASFVGTDMSNEAKELMSQYAYKNLADVPEYPALARLHDDCVHKLGHLWNLNDSETAIGSATTGSSEAVLLGGLAMKRRWQEGRTAVGKDTLKPNIIMGSNAQVALEKFARYFEVEARILPISPKSQFRLDPELIRGNIDENTIGVFVILGSTYTGHYEPVQEISDILDAFEIETGISVPIHVDAASGGFVAPFADAGAGGLKWDFSLPRVKSINTSSHKFGLVYVGLGWIVWRDASYLPKHLSFDLDYLGKRQQSYTLNFSRPGAQVIAQCFNFINLGFNGYKTIIETCLANARRLSKSLEATGWYFCVSDIHRKKGSSWLNSKAKAFGWSGGETSADYNAGLPVVAFRFSDEFKTRFPRIEQQAVSDLLRARSYCIPNYALPPGEKTEILRVVVRWDFSVELVDQLTIDTIAVTQELMDTAAETKGAFHDWICVSELAQSMIVSPCNSPR